MWTETPTMAAWAAAMTMQTRHELDCAPCRANRTPVCAEGLRLQTAAHEAHEAWVSDTYARLAVA